MNLKYESGFIEEFSQIKSPLLRKNVQYSMRAAQRNIEISKPPKFGDFGINLHSIILNYVGLDIIRYILLCVKRAAQKMRQSLIHRCGWLRSRK